MRRTFKKAMSIFLVVTMLLCVAPLNSFIGIELPSFFEFGAEAASYSGICGDNLTWSLNAETGVLNIVGTGAMTDYKESYDGASTAPWYSKKSQIKSVTIGNDVTSIGNMAFWYCDNLASVTLGNNIESIGDWSFYKCTKLANIAINNNLKSIGGCAFSHCSSLSNIAFSENLTVIGNSAFKECTNLTNLIIPDSVTEIHNYAFYGCTSLLTLTIPQRLTKINDYVFYKCTSLSTVTIPDNISSIGNSAFGMCDNLTLVTIPDNVKSIGINAFSSCVSLVSIELPKNITEIKYGTFHGCTKLISVTIPDGVTSIGEHSFGECENLQSVTIPANVTTIGDCAFKNCYTLTDVYYGSTEERWNEISIGTHNDALISATIHFVEPELQVTSGKCGDNLIWSFDESTSELVISGTGKMANWSSYPDVPWYSFKSAIKSVTIGDGVTSIGQYAFHYHENLEKVTISDSVTSIGVGAFSDCNNLANIVIPCGVKYINAYAFSSCGNLNIVTIFDSVTDIGYCAFDKCYDITDVYYMGSEKQWNEIKSGDFNNNLLGATIHYSHIHSMDTIEESAASTCTEKGYKKGTCICEYKYTEELPLLEHDIVIDKAVEATCTETGFTQGQHCSRCDNATIEQEVVPALNHKDTLVKVDAKSPTCTEIGWDAYEYCTACDYTTYIEKEALEHDIVIDEAVDSTCAATGLTEGQHCSRCDDMTIEQEVISTKPHNHTAMYDSVKHWKECVCDSKIEEENHSFIDGNICSCGYERTIDVAIAIKNNNGSRTINYGETLELTAIVSNTANVPENAVVEWYVDGVKSGEGETFRIKFESGTKTVEVKLADENGVVYQDTTKSEISDSENVTVKAGFFQKLISFFKDLFRVSRIILQSM